MTRQFTINLNREEGYAQREERKTRLRARITNVLATIALLAMAFLTYENDKDYRGIVNAKKQQLERIQFQIDSLQQVGRNVSKDDVLNLERLERDRVLWTQKVFEIANRLPEEMVISGMHLDRNELTIECISEIEEGEKEFDKVALYMDRLRQSEDFFDDVLSMKFKESRLSTKEVQELLHFSLICEIRASESTSRRGASRRASGVGGMR